MILHLELTIHGSVFYNFRESEAYAIPQREKYSGDVTEKHYKPKFKEVPSNVAIKEGKLTRFDCRVTGRPPPDLTWYRNGQQVFNDASHKVCTAFITSVMEVRILEISGSLLDL